jgi:parallel beta-helix repeat protein
MMKIGKISSIIVCLLMVAMVFAVAVPVNVIAEEPGIPGEPELPVEDNGRWIESNGTYFEIANSEYLNITLTSSENVQIFLESVPRIVSFSIEAESTTTSTTITLTGFEASKTYYRYQDGYLQEEFTTDESGSYSYTQDISINYHVYIQEEPSTLYISSDYTFTGDIYEPIVVDADNIVIDGNDFTLQGAGSGYGIYMNGRLGVTIKNVVMNDFSYGIWLFSSSDNTVIGNTVSGMHWSFFLHSSSNRNTVSGNTVSDGYYGIVMHKSGSNILRNNVIVSNTYNFGVDGLSLWHYIHDINPSNTVDGKPIYYLKDLSGVEISPNSGYGDAGYVGIVNSDHIIVKDLTLTKNMHGILLAYTSDSTIQNVVVSNNNNGIWMHRSNRNTISGTTVSDSTHQVGIRLYSSSGNTISGNTVSGNLLGIGLYWYSRSNTISDNTVSGGYRGIYLSYSSSNSVSGNTFSGFWIGPGIQLYSSSSNTINGNTALGKQYGISLYWYSSSNTISGNTVSGGGYGIHLYYSSSNSIFLNNIIDNTNQLYNYQSTNTWDNDAGKGNYWSDYPGNDHGVDSIPDTGDIGEGDGVGDSDLPHQGVDYYPLMQLVQGYEGYTPGGESVPVNPDPDISMTFDEVTITGITTVTTSDTNPGAGLANFKFLGTYYDIATTASFNNDITICISYDDTGIPAGKEAKLKIFHWEDTDGNGVADAWVDRTIPDDPPDNPNPDTVNNIICAQTSSLSWFALAYLDNAPPEITLTGPASGSIFPVGTPVAFRGTFTDPNTEDSHTAIWEFSSLNNDISLAGTVTESSGSGTVSNDYSFTTPGVYSVSLTVSDGGLLDTVTTIGDLDAMVIIYDPEDGFVTGGGWIDSLEGAYSADSSLTGKASYGFVSKYQKGASTPTGETQFQFKVVDLNFHSISYDWLVVGGARAQYKGSGTINGEGDYGFMLTAVDGDLTGGGGEDKFRIKIWDKATNVIVYDNQMDAEDGADLSTMIGGGSIKIHKG